MKVTWVACDAGNISEFIPADERLEEPCGCLQVGMPYELDNHDAVLEDSLVVASHELCQVDVGENLGMHLDAPSSDEDHEVQHVELCSLLENYELDV